MTADRDRSAVAAEAWLSEVAAGTPGDEIPPHLAVLAVEAEASDGTPSSMSYANARPSEKLTRLAEAAAFRDGADRSVKEAGFESREAFERYLDGPARAAPDITSPDHAPDHGRNILDRFRGADELVGELPQAIEWDWRLYVARGTITELVGRAKAAGKTTLIGHLIRAKLDGHLFLDQPTSAGAVVLLTEQPPASLRAVLERTGLSTRADLRILLWRDVRGSSWNAIVEGAVAECRRVGSTLLIVDTLPAFAGIKGDSENDAGAALQAIEPLQVAAAAGLAVLVVRHERKGGGEVGDSGRGSSAFTGAVDVVLRLGRQDNPVRPTVRTLSALSRFDETPAELVIELTDSGYVALGDQTEIAFAVARQAILDVVPEPPANGISEGEIIRLVGGAKSTVGAALRSLLGVEVQRDGEGRRGAPFVYTRVQSDSGFDSPDAPYGGASLGRKQILPVSVGDRQAAIFHPVDDDEPEDVDAAIAAAFPWPGEAASA
ncbi:MAG: AAA family ATPase [Chloroflexota bacterium]